MWTPGTVIRTGTLYFFCRNPNFETEYLCNIQNRIRKLNNQKGKITNSIYYYYIQRDFSQSVYCSFRGPRMYESRKSLSSDRRQRNPPFCSTYTNQSFLLLKTWYRELGSDSQGRYTGTLLLGCQPRVLFPRRMFFRKSTQYFLFVQLSLLVSPLYVLCDLSRS